MTISKNRPREYSGGYDLRGSYVLERSTGLVTGAGTRTATVGHLFGFRWSSATSTKCFIKRVGARFTCTTAYTTAQRTGVDMILARTYTAAHTGGTQLDVGSTVADSGNVAAGQATSLVAASMVTIATTGDITAGTQTLDANPIGSLVGWTAAIGDQVPVASSRMFSPYGILWDSERSSHGAPIVLTTDEGFVLRNYILMGATGVGVWDFLVEWDEGVPH